MAGVVAIGFAAGAGETVLLVLALIGCIVAHEFGHYITAKAAGIKVTEFFVGFGPRLWSVRRGETEYGVKGLPLGGYCRILGMNNLEEVDPADEPRTYRQAPLGRRLSVALAGSAMHFLIAVMVLFVDVLLDRGQRQLPQLAHVVSGFESHRRAGRSAGWRPGGGQPGPGRRLPDRRPDRGRRRSPLLQLG